MEKIWLKSYQASVPQDINPDHYASLGEMFEETCKKYAHKNAFVNHGTYLSFESLEAKTKAFAAYLQQALHLKKGDRFAIMMPNLLTYPIALFGALRAGLIVVNINPLYTPRELEFQLKDSGAKTLLVLENFAHTVESVLKEVPLEHIIVAKPGDEFPFPKSVLANFIVRYIKKMIPKWSIPNAISYQQVLEQGKKLTYQKPSITGDDTAFLQYTGGTTGIAKGAMLSHRNLLANIEQATAWIRPVIQENEIIITALPLYHIFSLTANCLIFFKIGGLNVLIPNPRDMKSFIKELRQYPFTAITGVNTLFNALLNNEKISTVSFSSLRLSLGGGMAVQRTVAKKWKERTGSTLLEAYGLTEASPAVTINPMNLPDFNGSIGLPLPSTDVSIRDEEGNELPLNTAGELWVKGPQVTQGYWHQKIETERAFKNGWLATGDICKMDEKGFLYLIERKKDMIVVSGFNVYPNEVEDVIALHPGVKEVAVVGKKTEQGEQVKAFIVKRDPQLTQEDIIKHCREQLTPYKIPKEIEFREELPKTNVGKILRRALKEETHEV